MLLAPRAQAVTYYYWQPESGTSSWFTAENWNTRAGGDGSSAVPVGTNGVQVLHPGVCALYSASTAVVDRVTIYGVNGSGLFGELLVESGASLTISNYFRIGSGSSYGYCDLRGAIKLVNNLNTGCELGGYSTVHVASRAILDINGGTYTCGSVFGVGNAGTGTVTIANGGTLAAKGITRVAYGYTPTCNGKITLNDGTWINDGTILVSRNAGQGTVEINGGTLSITNQNGAITIGSGTGASGKFFLNGGELKGALFQRETLNVGRVGGTGLFVQNGGICTVIGVRVGENGGTGTAIISNGVFNAKSTSGSWPGFDLYQSGHLIIAGGEYNCFSSAATGQIRDGAVLELREGSLSMTDSILYTHSNSTIRVIGPGSDFNMYYWRHDSPESGLGPANTTLELTLTQDAGHLSPIKALHTSHDTAQPGILKVGFAGGACMLATNQIPYLWAGRNFSTAYVNPANYGLALWDAAKVDLPTGGDNMEISLKSSSSQGSATLPSESLTFADAAYGYIDVDNMNSGTLPELIIDLSLTEVDGTAQQILKDLQAAGYTNSTLDGTTISMAIPRDDLPSESGHFAWDFREFDGSTNATVSAVSFMFAHPGTIIIVK